MAGVKPNITCGKCGAKVSSKDNQCPSCGTHIDWPSDIMRNLRSLSSDRTNSKQLRLLIVLVILAMGVIVYEAATEKSVPAAVQPQNAAASQPMANVQAMEEAKQLEDAVTANPTDMASVLRLANLLHDSQVYDKAVKYYRLYLDKNPGNADARVDLGICYKELGDLDDAKKEMLEALKIDPKHLHAHFNLGIVALAAGNLEESNEWFKKTVALAPNSDVGQRAQQLINQHKSQ